MQEYKTPFPASLIRVMEKTQLAYLATCENQEPHLSLMKFSFQKDEDLVCLASFLIVTFSRATSSS